MKVQCITLMLCCLLPATSFALTSVVTGDSMTNAYYEYLEAGDVSWMKVASGGLRSRGYVGLEPDHHQNFEHHHFAIEALAMEPDVFVLLLGTNDAVQGPEYFTEEYVPLMSEVYELLEASEVCVVLGVPPPILREDLLYASHLLEELYRPWLIEQARERGFVLLDFWSEIQTLTDWQELYDDGLHLRANEGEGAKWMARRVGETVLEAAPQRSAKGPICDEVPEPSRQLQGAAALLMLALMRRRGAMSEWMWHRSQG